jgi:hypothetical protein
MRCWNCGKKIPEKAKVCRFCEAAVEDEPTEEEKDACGDIPSGLGNLPSEPQDGPTVGHARDNGDLV